MFRRYLVQQEDLSEFVYRVRKTLPKDLPRVLEIYQYARQFMAHSGNPHQWGDFWPPIDLLRQDIAAGDSYVCECNGRLVGTFFYQFGPDIDPTYRVINDGAWQDDSAYGVMHRLAGDGSVRGIGKACIEWCYARCGHLRIDTHGDNRVMQNLLRKLGFVYCGVIYVEKDNDPRLAFEKSALVSGCAKNICSNR